ncbi:hypothetical protein BO70DRAFT_350697 [Aspergillus heteromorphus CBS 117.55]|uniref:Uncharacterized protein n=1 Tax=Aspergillus heteromorphus CBS 117.55 TaxID=1448321 RepID=A0A317WPH9_9EURO|nr:uncharacterized protein BO70DRAFT_350697 [Aspergillus heteromorphus CBS 117.55]PWY88323.1 hypothetical protein BO70DRAFT_350697 [Aspergillus heteromorphus CBS 117.55]
MADPGPGHFTAPGSAVFVTNAIENASNPSDYGFHHGPISTTVPIPDDEDDINTVAETGWDADQMVLSRFHSGICWIEVNPGEMCGMVFDRAPSLYRHIREGHHVDLRTQTTGNIRLAERVAGQNALRLYIRDQHWRFAHFVHEHDDDLAVNRRYIGFLGLFLDLSFAERRLRSGDVLFVNFTPDDAYTVDG